MRKELSDFLETNYTINMDHIEMKRVEALKKSMKNRAKFFKI